MHTKSDTLQSVKMKSFSKRKLIFSFIKLTHFNITELNWRNLKKKCFAWLILVFTPESEKAERHLSKNVKPLFKEISFILLLFLYR